jgi:hypothetical protein
VAGDRTQNHTRRSHVRVCKSTGLHRVTQKLTTTTTTTCASDLVANKIKVNLPGEIRMIGCLLPFSPSTKLLVFLVCVPSPSINSKHVLDLVANKIDDFGDHGVCLGACLPMIFINMHCFEMHFPITILPKLCPKSPNSSSI